MENKINSLNSFNHKILNDLSVLSTFQEFQFKKNHNMNNWKVKVSKTKSNTQKEIFEGDDIPEVHLLGSFCPSRPPRCIACNKKIINEIFF